MEMQDPKIGGSGVVTCLTRNGREVAEKVPRQGQEAVLRREMEILKDLVDPHIVMFYGFQESPMVLHMEPIDGGNLSDALVSRSLKWDDKERIAVEIAYGLAYLDSQDIIHCDIKSDNIMLTKNREVKVCDFGSAMRKPDSETEIESCVSTIGWMAPELEDPTKYSHKSDIYALGVVMWQMATNEDKPSGNRQGLSVPDHTPLEYARVMQACWSQNPLDRPDASDVALTKFDPQLEMPSEDSIDIPELFIEGFNGRIVVDFVSGMPWSHCLILLPLESNSNGDTAELYRLGISHFQNKEYIEAMECFKKMEHLGFVQYTLYCMYSSGLGVQNDPAKAIEYLKSSVSQGFDRALATMAYFFHCQNQHEKAFEYANKSRRVGRAMYVLAETYRRGVGGVKKNKNEARKWHLLLAEKGGRESHNILGVMCVGDKNDSDAVKYYRNAAEQGDPVAQCNLGALYKFGHGVPKDLMEAIKWIKRSEEQNHPHAIASLGLIYFQSQRYKEAYEYSCKAAQMRDPMALNILGVMHRNGNGMPIDDIAAINCFSEAAKRGNTIADESLAKIYSSGIGVERDPVLSMKHLKKAADNGGTASKLYAADVLHERSVELRKEGKDKESIWMGIESDCYLNLAIDGGDISAKARSLLLDLYGIYD
ncbi:hypothetical protein BGZ49_004452 [Haplosporangium sp. Z 27]|nr:hypothetical protein BGZ49_004452 [Haplosporangium sp. Z 27]